MKVLKHGKGPVEKHRRKVPQLRDGGALFQWELEL